MQNKPDMLKFVTELLKNGIPPYYYYHNYEHTLYVLDMTIKIARAEKCSDHEVELVRTAALWHDTGFIRTYNGHEQESQVLAGQYLPEFGFSNEDISQIQGMIMATKIPQSPQTRLEEIVADADLEYLGTPDAAGKAENLFLEWKYLDPSLTREEWNRRQIAFLKSHHYFTAFCAENREATKATYLERLVKDMKSS